MTYRSFITPVGLLRAIIKIYEQSPPSNLSHQQFDIYFRTKVIPTRLRYKIYFFHFFSKTFSQNKK